MKIGITFSLTLAAAATLAMSTPARAQSRHMGGGGGTAANRGGNGGGTVANRSVGNHGRFFYHGRWYSGSRFNFYFGGFGYPFYGYPYYGYPYYGYPYGYYGYAPYGAGYAPGPNGVYEGRAVGRSTNDNGDAKDSDTAQVQRHLSQAGYYHGSIDGVAGDGTRRAIRSYQRDNGLPVTGRIDGDLLGALGVS